MLVGFNQDTLTTFINWLNRVLDIKRISNAIHLLKASSYKELSAIDEGN